jgi:hypothetical protein
MTQFLSLQTHAQVQLKIGYFLVIYVPSAEGGTVCRVFGRGIVVM